MRNKDKIDPRWSIPTAVILMVTPVLVTHHKLETAKTVLLITLILCGTVVSIKDIKERRIPDAILVPWAIGTGTLLLVTAALTMSWPPLLAVLAGILLGGIYLVFGLITGGVGLGDIKLATITTASAALYSLQVAGLALFLAALCALPVGLAVLARAGSFVGVRIPYGPFLVFGAGVAMAWAWKSTL